jgi:hypothetical protein
VVQRELADKLAMLLLDGTTKATRSRWTQVDEALVLADAEPVPVGEGRAITCS